MSISPSTYNNQVEVLSCAVFASLVRNELYDPKYDGVYLVDWALAEIKNPSIIDGETLHKVINSITEFLAADNKLNGVSNKFRQDVYEIYFANINKQESQPEFHPADKLDEILQSLDKPAS